jgi:hypothetical protein
VNLSAYCALGHGASLSAPKQHRETLESLGYCADHCAGRDKRDALALGVICKWHHRWSWPCVRSSTYVSWPERSGRPTRQRRAHAIEGRDFFRPLAAHEPGDPRGSESDSASSGVGRRSWIFTLIVVIGGIITFRLRKIRSDRQLA